MAERQKNQPDASAPNQNLQEMFEFGSALVGIQQTEGGKPFIVLPGSEHEGFKPVSVEKFMERPARIENTITLGTPDSFIDYVSRFVRHGQSVLFASRPEDRTVTCVIDYHTSGEYGDRPSWCSHTAHFTCPPSKEWRIWTGKNGAKMGQRDFAEFLEDNADDIVVPDEDKGAPTAADMMEIARSFEAKTSAEFRSGTRLDNGDVELTYNEQTEASANGRTGKVTVPEHFYVLLRPFDGSPAYPIKAKLRYRAKEGMLVLWYDLHRPDLAEEECFLETVQTIEEGTKLSALRYR
ncbi:DUF2303 family protein [Halofilum ochraceum]|uniref:DUF2303 family protein n=1 Tax=Halofilum ochraceum TaxID=1611323 RepID=UPI0008DB27BF|nr:DUF2303 family protein [Halofilum ochraceum]